MGLLQMSFTGAILILVIIVIRAIAIHRLPKKTFLVLWIIALARLLLPFSVPSPFSVYLLVRGNEPDFQTSDTVVYENRQPMYQVEVEQIQNNPVVSNTTQALQTAPHISIWTTLWIIGMLIVAGLFLVSYLRCRREFRTALPIHNAIITEWLDEHQLKRKIEIRQFSGILTPMTYGVIHPVILLPQNSDWENKQQLQYILYHEFVHICRYDTVLKILATIVLCIHWFNPMVWVMYILFNRDIELTCDECVIREFGRANRSDYARMLISVEERKSLFAPFCNNFSKNAIEERIESIMKTKKTSVITWVLACMIIVGTTGVFATSVSAGEDNHSTTEESTQTITNTVICRMETDGTTYYSWDDGQIWTALTDEEYEQLFPAQNVEWWTYEEYAEWLENEKQELANIIGEKCWTPSKGEFVWTEEMVEETIQMYEEILEEIKNGMLYSKSIDGDAMTMTGYSISEDMVISEDTVVSKYDSMAVEQITNTERFRIYEQFGMTYDVNKNQLTFNGKLVRWFEDYYLIDGTNQAGVYHFNEDGIIDVHAVRDFSKIERNADGSFDPSGELVGLKQFSQEEFDSRNIDRIKNSTQEAIAGYPISDNEINSWITEYGAFGVTYDKSNDQWYFNGEKVRRFRDILTSNGEDLSSGKFHGFIRTLNGNGTVDIYTVRDFDNLNSEGNGTLIDVKVYSQEEFDEYTKSSGIMIETP